MSTDASPAAGPHAGSSQGEGHDEGHGGGHGGTKAILAALGAYLGMREELLVAARIAVRHDETAACVAEAIDAAEARIRAAVPIARVVYLEPDLRRTPSPERSGSPPVARD